jgi:molybdopterin molybdotransferase
MILFDKALAVVMSRVPVMGVERVALGRAAGRTIARDVRSDVDMPPADHSAMDGYACRRIDLQQPLRIIETVAAGSVPRKKVTAGTCIRIMTGARIPEGADTVVMFEDSVEAEGVVAVSRIPKRTNIRFRAEDITKGDVVIRKRTVVTPAVVAVLASAGCAEPWVYRRARVGVIATGDELVEPDTKPHAGQIRNSNGWQLSAQVQGCGCEAVYYGIARDTPLVLERSIRKALRECDVVLLSGGVSTGDFDYVPRVLAKNNVRLLFEKVAVKPGKPTVFGTAGRKRVFGMPGNPVSSFVIFEALVRPFLCRMMGRIGGPKAIRLPLEGAVVRKNASRLEFRPAMLTGNGTIVLPEYHGSAHIHAYTAAQGMVALPAGKETMKAGSLVAFTLLAG